MAMHRGITRRLPVLACAALLALAAAAGSQVGAPSAAYRLGPRDLVRIKVFEVPELNVDAAVTPTGTVTLPLIGDVAAEGLTDTELAARLKAVLEERYVNRASVSVQLLEARSRPITLLGAVRQPGNLAFPGRWTLLDALSAAGGLTESHGGVILVLRRAENGLTDQLSIPVEDLLVRGRTEANIPIRTADIINVPARVEITVYCLGAVRSPGEIKFASTDRVTLLSAIARAGGLNERAAKTIRLKRASPEGDGEETVYHYGKLLSGKEQDPLLEDGDFVVVKESLF